MSGSCVTISTVMPRSTLSRHSSSMISLAALGVEVAGGLVGQQHRGLGDDGARDRHALLLAARQLGRRVVLPAGQAHRGQRLARRPRGARPRVSPR